MMHAGHNHNGANNAGPRAKGFFRNPAPALIAVAIALLAPNGPAQASDELEEFRKLIRQQQEIIQQQQQRDAQQQREIEALKLQVRALQEASETTERVAEDARREVDAVRQDVAQAQDQAGEARQIAETARAVTIERSEQGLGEWTRGALGARQPVVEEKEEVPIAEVITEPEGFTVSLGGHINRAVNVADDGDDTKAYFVDNGNVPTLTYLKASAPVNDDLTIGGHIEVALQENSANAVSQNNESSGLNSSSRHFEVTAESKKYGKLWFGKGFASAFFLAEVDKTGTYGPNLLSVGNTAGGLQFYNKDTDSLSGIPVAQAFLDIEGINLRNRARYDSPVWRGFQLSGDVGEDQFADVALRWNRELGDFDMTFVSSGQKNPQGQRSDWRVDGALGLLHKPTGLNLTVGAARTDNRKRSNNSDGYMVRAGLRRNWFDIGETKTSFDYSNIEDITEDGDKARSAGAFLVQEVRDWNMEFYTGYRWYDLDRNNDNLDSINVFNFGARYWFDLTAKVPRS